MLPKKPANLPHTCGGIHTSCSTVFNMPAAAPHLELYHMRVAARAQNRNLVLPLRIRHVLTARRGRATQHLRQEWQAWSVQHCLQQQAWPRLLSTCDDHR